MQIEFSDSQLIKAKPSFERSESSRVSQKGKQELPRISTDAGM
jgi:hypothetical protein